MEHESLTAYMMELSERKRQGLLLGLRPEELDRIEAEWSRVKPELDEWRWRLDEALPGDWKQVGLWLAQAERRLIADAEVANQLGLEMAPGAVNMTPTERFERLQKCLQQHEVSVRLYSRTTISSFKFFSVNFLAFWTLDGRINFAQGSQAYYELSWQLYQHGVVQFCRVSSMIAKKRTFACGAHGPLQ